MVHTYPFYILKLNMTEVMRLWLSNPVCLAQCLTWQCGNLSGITGDIGGAALLCSILRIVMGRSHQGTPWVCVLRENWQEQKREERDSNKWAIVREIEEHLYGLSCSEVVKWKHISPLTATVDLTPCIELLMMLYSIEVDQGGVPKACCFLSEIRLNQAGLIHTHAWEKPGFSQPTFLLLYDCIQIYFPL